MVRFISFLFKVRLTNTVVRLEYLPGIEQQGLAVELHVGKLEYRGQAGQVELLIWNQGFWKSLQPPAVKKYGL